MRLRQICFVAKDLEDALKNFSFIIGSEVCFRDEGVSHFGLENGLLEIDGNFIEVVSPFKQDTTAERFMSKMNGDAGYMLIFECENADLYRQKAEKFNIRSIWKTDLENGVKATHYHPKDIGGLIISVDSMNKKDWQDKNSYWQWAGDDWQLKTNNQCSISSISMSCKNPSKLANQWGSFLDLSVNESRDTYIIEGDDFKIFFMYDDIKRIDYLSQLTLKINNSELKDKIFQKYKENEIEICGTKIELI